MDNRTNIQPTGGGGIGDANNVNGRASSPSQPAAAPAAATSQYPRTFYRRQLPSQLISFSSPEGRAVFASAMASGGTYSFFPLIEQL